MKTGVRERLRLLGNRLHDSRMTMPGVEDGDTRGEINEAPAIDVPQLGVLRLGNENTPATHPGGHRRGLAVLELS